MYSVYIYAWTHVRTRGQNSRMHTQTQCALQVWVDLAFERVRMQTCTFEHLGRVNLAGTLPVLEVVVELCSVVSYLDDLVTQEHYVLNVLL